MKQCRKRNGHKPATGDREWILTPEDGAFALLIAVIENPVNPWVANNAVVITNPGTDQMQITIKKGREMKQYRSAGEIGEGEGTKAGTAYMLKDGTMVYVPEGTTP